MDHTPVLLQEVLVALQPKSTGRYVDATLGDGGHAAAILEHSKPSGRILGLEQDPQQLSVADRNLQGQKDRVILVNARFSNLLSEAKRHDFIPVDGILFDLGISSRQLDNPSYGLTFSDTASLDMRLSPDLTESAAQFLNSANEVELGDILYRYGDRHNSRVLARKLVGYRRKRQFTSAYDVKMALNLWNPSHLAPIFQALRIWVNKEYEELESALPQAVDLLVSGGVLAVITFHSGEDRIVKQFLQKNKDTLTVNKQIIRPEYEEIKRNPRSRSAILRRATKK